MNTKLIKEAEDFVINEFGKNSPAENIYHNYTHTAEVVESAKKIGEFYNIPDEDMEVLILAAWFHDLGYVQTSNGHEKISAEYARDFLQRNNYPEEKLKRVVGCIKATKLPQSPENLLEEIVCDADLLHVGKEGFEEKSDLLRAETEHREKKKYTDVEWLKKNLDFFTSHKFFTRYAIERFTDQKNANYLKLQKKYKKAIKKSEKNEVKKRKFQIDQAKIEVSKGYEKTAGRTIETMFRNVMRTHVEFSSMADNKANIMISVNTLIITIIVSIMSRKFDSNPHLIIPTAILTLSSLTALIYSVLVTRPKVTSGTFSKEDIENKKANLLFFGNFYNMPLNDFHWGMQELIHDRDFLYDSMINDFYFLGQVLGHKYKYLRIAYTIFMYGLIISVIAFTVAILLHPGATNLSPLIE
ncbi:MAG: hypothetical protein Kow0098_16340 [Ignavibacteriaceae bacterium]